jgi:hypothetical protein
MSGDAVMEQLYALVLLAWALVRTLVASVFGSRRGLAAFEKSYAKDRLPPVSPEERRALPLFGGCIACGLCDLGEGARAAASLGVYAGVMDLMLASSRSMPDFDVAAASFDAVGEARLAELEKGCPTRVPMREVAAFVRGKARDLSGRAAPKRLSAKRDGS